MASVHEKLNRVRKPRVHITYDVETEGAVVEKELPFVVGVLGDFSGDPTEPLKPLNDRKFIQIDRDNFDQILARIRGEELPLPNASAAQRAAGSSNFEWMDALIFLVFAVPMLSGLLRGMFGNKLGTVLTGVGAGGLAWVLTAVVWVAIGAGLLAFPIAYYMARYTTGKTKAFFYIAVMMPMWASYIVKAYAWTLLLAKGGVAPWFVQPLGLEPLLQFVLGIPGVGGSTLSTSHLGRFMVFVYIWLPFMILPIQASLQRLP
eukprot:gene52495-64158_t